MLIDNYDSFTYNLVQYLGDLNVDTHVIRNDKTTPQEVLNLNPRGVVISPGPSDPDHAGICLEMVKTAADNDLPLLGVCLGHQCIGQVFGGKIIQTSPMHGKVSEITHNEGGVFRGLPSPLKVTRYHSLIVERTSCPDELEVTAQTQDDIIMGLAHKTKPIYGVQFHPESIATSNGHDMLNNFIQSL